MKIVLNLISANAGGQVTRARSFLDRVIECSPKLELVVFKIAGAMPELISRKGIEVLEVNIDSSRPFFALRRMLWENIQMLPLLSKINTDVYLSFSHYLPVKKLGIPTVVAVSNLAPFSKAAYHSERNWGRMRLIILRRTIIFSAQRANEVIALSSKCKKVLIENDVPAAKIKVIPNGVDRVRDSIDLREELMGRENPYILSVSHFYRYKNFEQLINAYAILPPSVRNQWRLKIVGKFYDQGYTNELKILAERLEIGDRVDFISGLYLEELHEMYLGATVFVFSSLIENSPNILLEAMAYGIPTISNGNDPMPEFGGDAVTYFKSQDNDDLATKIASILNDKSLLDKMSLQAKNQSSLFFFFFFTNDVIGLCSLVSKSNLH